MPQVEQNGIRVEGETTGDHTVPAVLLVMGLVERTYD
mgnify:FL=1|jgi:hypothetical protein